jgi:DNA-binding transcriptional MerR regulator
MITTNEITEATGLSPKTLTRWHKRGILPEPLVGDHPSGRGKVGYWPDEVVERVQHIQKLRAEGHSLKSALMTLESLRLDRIIEQVTETPDFVEILKGKKVKIGPDTEADLLRVFVALTLRAAQLLSANDGGRPALANSFGEAEVRMTFQLFQNGFNPVLVFDGDVARVVPDFMVAHELSGCLREVTALIIVPMLPLVRKLLGELADSIPDPKTRPAQKVLGLNGDTFLEYDIHMGGPLGFELIHNSGRVVGTRKPEDTGNE